MTEQQPSFSIEKIYLRDLSLEIPNAPAAFLQREAPNIDIDLHTEGSLIEEELFEAIVTITVTAKVADKTLFLVEAAQAGVFYIRNLPKEQVEAVLGITCPNILFPYLREIVSSTVTHAGFPPVVLNPINFEALYRQQQSQQEPAPATH
jgi:preprotein translocase subunit SecB